MIADWLWPEARWAIEHWQFELIALLLIIAVAFALYVVERPR